MSHPTLNSISRALSCVAGGALLLGTALPSFAGGTIQIDDTKSISIGAGIRAALTMQEDGAPDGDSYSNSFDVQNVRLYISGQTAEHWKFTINTEEIWGEMGILDAMIQYEPNQYFNVWAGRVLTPADRVEMNGPFYGLTWNQYTQPLYASDNDPQPKGRAGQYGRDDGFVIWGSAAKFQYAIGVFDGLSTDANETDAPLYAMRFAYNFLNMEKNPGYYTSSTYHGGLGDILTLGFSAQMQKDGTGTSQADGDAEDFTGYAFDVLFEKVLGGSVLTLEGEYKVFETDYVPQPGGFGMFNGDSMFATAAFLFPATGPGRLQPYLRFTETSPKDGDKSDLSELGLNYVIKSHSLRLNANFTDGDANPSGAASDGAKTFTVGMQYQI